MIRNDEITRALQAMLDLQRVTVQLLILHTQGVYIPLDQLGGRKP
jgi:hypothetical protein